MGADGRFSQVRKTLSGAPKITQFGVSIFRLLVPDTSGGLISDYEQWFHQDKRLLGFRIPQAMSISQGLFPSIPQPKSPSS